MQNKKVIPIPVKLRAIIAPLLFFGFLIQYLTTGCIGQLSSGTCGGFSVWVLAILFVYSAFWVGFFFFKLYKNRQS